MSDRKFSAFGGVLGVLAIGLAMAGAIPSWRQSLRDQVITSNRQIVAKSESPLSGQYEPITVIKVQTPDTLSLEVYSRGANPSQLIFQKRVILPEKRDGYFTFRGNATNLVLTDLDNDGQPEIVAPAFDENLVPRLNVFKYDPATQNLTRLGPDSLKF